MMENEKEANQEKTAILEMKIAEKELTASVDEMVAHETMADDTHDLTDEKSAIDYTAFSKQQLLEVVKELTQSNDFKSIDTIIKEVKPLFDEYRNKERTQALEKFKSEGGAQDDFEFRQDETDQSFDATLRLLRDRKNQFYKSLEETKTENLRKRNDLLEQLRALVDGEDSAQSFQIFKTLQQEWRKIGPVPNSNLKTLWANYNALVDRFYDHRNIYFELKELDRKRNLEAKNELCAKAERLLQSESIKDAVRELNDLHDEFKHIGPVPKDEQENLWQRFKKASDEVYAKRDAFVSSLQKELYQNLELKDQLINEIAALAAFSSDRIKEWNQKTQELLAIQKKWEAIGAVPRAKAKEINKKFWTGFKTFFHNKSLFFKKLDSERDANLKAKQELVARALALKESEDWSKTSQELMDLQRRWKEVGPVPEKVREKIYKEFKDACDYFFEQRRGIQDKADQEQENNLKEKESILAAIAEGASSGNGSLQELQQLQSRFEAIGFVPKRVMASVKQRFEEATRSYLDSLKGLSADEKEQAILESQLAGLKNDPQAERKLVQKEQALRKQIQKAENDLAVLKNNLEFFGRSKNADKFKAEFNEKMQSASEHLLQLKKQLKLIKSA
jgi:hypothetical protein